MDIFDGSFLFFLFFFFFYIVLRAIGVEEDLAHTSIRFGIGRFTTIEEIDLAINLCVRHVTRLREMSPLWEMVQEGVDIKSIQWTQEH